jgi:hypothetical protein
MPKERENKSTQVVTLADKKLDSIRNKLEEQGVFPSELLTMNEKDTIAAEQTRTRMNLETGHYPLEMFLAQEEMLCLPAIEEVIVRIHEGKLQVFLTKRDSNDPIEGWRGKYYNRGVMGTKVDVSDDGSYSKNLDKLIKTEPSGLDVSESVYVKSLCQPTGRGPEESVVHWAYAKSGEPDPEQGKFIDFEKLPVDEMIDHHVPITKAAVKGFIACAFHLSKSSPEELVRYEDKYESVLGDPEMLEILTNYSRTLEGV